MDPVWNDYQGKRDAQHPTQLPQVSEGASRLEAFLNAKFIRYALQGFLAVSALFFLSQVGFWLRYRVWNRQEALPFPEKPHVQVHRERQRKLLESYQYHPESGLFSMPIEVAMRKFVERPSAVLLMPQFRHVSESRLKVRTVDRSDLNKDDE